MLWDLDMESVGVLCGGFEFVDKKEPLYKWVDELNSKPEEESNLQLYSLDKQIYRDYTKDKVKMNSQ